MKPVREQLLIFQSVKPPVSTNTNNRCTTNKKEASAYQKAPFLFVVQRPALDARVL